MPNDSRIEVCAHCSGVDIQAIKAKGDVKIGCIGKCSKKCPELAGKVYGFLNGAFCVADSQQAFFEKVDALGPYERSGGGNPLVDAFLEHAAQWREEFQALRAIALDCGLEEQLKWGQPCYTAGGGNIAILGGFKEYAALSFFKGALLSDAAGLLVRQTQNVQEARQLRFQRVEEVRRLAPVIQAYLLEAMALEASGAKLPAPEKPALALPEELLEKFAQDPALKAAFFQLTPGRQRGYALHFSGAKQPATRAARIEKYAGKILEGKSLDD